MPWAGHYGRAPIASVQILWPEQREPFIGALGTRACPSTILVVLASDFEQEWRGPGLVAVTFGRVGEPEPVPSPRYADVCDASLFLNVFGVDVRQHTILK